MYILFFYALLGVITVLFVRANKDITIDLLSSEIFGDDANTKNSFNLYFILGLIWPVTLFKFLTLNSIKMSTTKTFSFKPFVKFAILIAIILALFNVGGKVINSYNQSVELESSFEVKKKERLASINRITVIVRQKLQVAKINDSSYTKNLMAIAVSRTSNANWQWLQENNANSNYGEVSKFYAEVLLSIQSERDILFSIEKELQSIDYQYTMLHRKFPTSIYLFWMPRKLDYMPISTSYNAEVNRTNIDSVTSL